MPAPSVYFWTPRLSLGHPGSFWSTHVLKCMRTQTGPRFNVSSEGRGTTTRVAHPYPHGTSRAGNRTQVVVGGVPGANHYTTEPVGREVTYKILVFIPCHTRSEDIFINMHPNQICTLLLIFPASFNYLPPYFFHNFPCYYSPLYQILFSILSIALQPYVSPRLTCHLSAILQPLISPLP